MVTPEVLNRYIKPGLIRIAENLHGIRLLYIGGKEAFNELKLYRGTSKSNRLGVLRKYDELIAMARKN